MRVFFFQAEDGIRDLVRSRGLGDVYKRQVQTAEQHEHHHKKERKQRGLLLRVSKRSNQLSNACLLYTSDAADERSSVDLGGRRIIKKKNRYKASNRSVADTTQDYSIIE